MAVRSSWTRTEVSELLRLRREGVSLSRCAEQLGRSYGATATAYHRFGKKPDPERYHRSYRRMDEDEERLIMACFLYGLSQAATGVKVNRSKQAITRVHKRLITDRVRLARPKFSRMKAMGAADDDVWHCARHEAAMIYKGMKDETRRTHRNRL